MRLLQVDDDGSFRLVDREGSDIPPYAISSHTWGLQQEEVTYSDLTTGGGKTSRSTAQVCSVLPSSQEVLGLKSRTPSYFGQSKLGV